MNIYDKYIEQTLRLLDLQSVGQSSDSQSATHPSGPACCRRDIASGVIPWPVADSNPFLMERDTALELGGYPKESINLLLSTSRDDMNDSGVWIVGETANFASDSGGTSTYRRESKHISFGKIVILTVKDVNDENIYEYTQQLKLKDSRLRYRDVMVRTSPEQFLHNLRVSRKAVANGFNLEAMGWAVHEYFMVMPQVEKVKVILIAGESELYRELIPVAENVRRVTTALNTMFDGIDMDCGSCSMSPICDEIEELRRIHAATK